MAGYDRTLLQEAQRIGFYSGILVDAIESGAVSGWAGVRSYEWKDQVIVGTCLLYTSPSPRD